MVPGPHPELSQGQDGGAGLPQCLHYVVTMCPTLQSWDGALVLVLAAQVLTYLETLDLGRGYLSPKV